MIGQQWLELSEFHELEQEIQFVIMVTQFQEKYVIIHNLKRQGWEFPGGNRELASLFLQLLEENCMKRQGQ